MQGKIDLIVFFEGSLEKPLHFKHPLEDVVKDKYNATPTLSLDNYSESITTAYLKDAFQNLNHILIIYLTEPNCDLGPGLTLLKLVKKARAKTSLDIVGQHETVLKMTRILSNTNIHYHLNQEVFTQKFE